MAQTDFAEFDSKSAGDRTLMNVLYGMHTIAPFTAWTLSVVALIINYVKRSGENDALYVSHHNYMVSTFWWTVLWIFVASLVTFVLIVTVVGLLVMWVPFTVLGIWYMYRFIRGWLRFSDGKPPR